MLFISTLNFVLATVDWASYLFYAVVEVKAYVQIDTDHYTYEVWLHEFDRVFVFIGQFIVSLFNL